jgi:hypothetical protein
MGTLLAVLRSSGVDVTSDSETLDHITALSHGGPPEKTSLRAEYISQYSFRVWFHFPYCLVVVTACELRLQSLNSRCWPSAEYMLVPFDGTFWAWISLFVTMSSRGFNLTIFVLFLGVLLSLSFVSIALSHPVYVSVCHCIWFLYNIC